MIKAAAHPREAERLSELHALAVLDTPREPGFDALTAAARRLAGYDIALVSLVDGGRQWFKSCAGPLDAAGTGRDVAFCAWTILDEEPFVVADALADRRFADNPLVTGPPFIRAYCGVPLAPSAGLAIGSLCLLHGAPRAPAPDQLALLRDLARVATEMLRMRARCEATAVMSHEIRSSLHGVIGLSGMIAATPGLPDEAAEQARLLAGAGEHLLRLTTDSLEYARIEAGRIALESAPFGPAAEVAAVLALLAPQAGAAGVTLASDIAPDVPRQVRGDAGRLRQVLLNLLGNAIRFAAGGDVRVALRAGEGPRLLFEVRDSGIDMTAEQLARLFEAFGQAEASTARRFGGSGLGLVICRRLVERMGGAIAVESAPGAGTVFRFDIAVAPAEETAPPPPQGAAAPCRPLRVLLAEDTPVVRLVTTHALHGLGHQVETAADGRAAVEAAAQGGFDVVLMDLEMPVMDGLAATRAIRALPGAAAAVRILGLTADQSEEAAAACREAGMDGVLWKPVRRPDLAVALG